MNSVIFLLIFLACAFGILGLVFKTEIHHFFKPEKYRYIFMETKDNELEMILLNIENRYSFMYKNGKYYLQNPEKFTVPKFQEVKEEVKEDEF